MDRISLPVLLRQVRRMYCLTSTIRSRLFAQGCAEDWVGTIDRITGKITHEGVAYRTHNAFATAHRRALRPDITPSVNAWKYVDVSDRDGVWFSLDRIHELVMENRRQADAARSNVAPAPLSNAPPAPLSNAPELVAPAPLSNAPELVVPSWDDVRAQVGQLVLLVEAIGSR